MADVRSLLRNERVSRRINHPHANYSDSGKLLCAVCNLHIKTESLWENHISSPQHTARLEHLRANPPPAPIQTKKRKAGESDDEGRKRVKAVPGGFVPEGFFDASEEGADKVEEGLEDVDTAPGPSTPAVTVADSQPVVPAPPPAPDVNEDEWAAFEREMAAEQHTALPIISASATISAAPVTAEELAAQAREEQNAKRTAREVEIEADNEDVALALQQEFDDMEELDERVRRLREKREALRLAKQQDTLPDAPTPIQELPQQNTKFTRDDKEEEDHDDDDDEDEFDDWTFGARLCELDVSAALSLKLIASYTLAQSLLNPKHARKLLEEEYRAQFVKKVNAPFKDSEISDKLGGSLEQLCTQSPWPRRKRSQEWLNEATASQEALDVFWSEMRTIWAHKLRRHGDVAESYIKEDIDDLMRHSQSDEQLADLVTQREYVHRQIALRVEKAADVDLNVAPQTVWGEDTDNRLTITTPVAQKTRTRSPASSGKPLEPPASLAHDTLVPKQTITKIAHFLVAMTDAGFSIIQSQGSAVTFKLQSDIQRGAIPIVFHRPHPVATLNPVMLRGNAKRITKWFGWHRENFVEREKEKA
ncbi:hypothetical protein E4T47_02011 [Aureobasidium subglaciale]|nr:hypothetical protein E4T47_02011 [Aureobasidium subglaciale]